MHVHDDCTLEPIGNKSKLLTNMQIHKNVRLLSI